MQYYIQSLFLILFSVLSLQAFSQKIYSCDNKYDADFIVFVAENKYDADLLVYKVETKYDAVENKGLWFFVENKYDADKLIYFADNKYDADLRVYFVENKYSAEWRDRSKMHLLF